MLDNVAKTNKSKLFLRNKLRKFKVPNKGPFMSMDGCEYGRTDRLTDNRTKDRLWYEINITLFLKKKAGIKIIGKKIFTILR